MKRSAFVKALLVLGLSTAAVTAVGQPAGAGGSSPEYDGRPGVMGGYGGGPGMMGGGPGRAWGNRFGRVLSQLGLTPEQQAKIARIHEDTRQKNWATMGQLLSEQFKLRGLYLADKLDADAIVEQQKNVDELRRVMLKAHIEMENQVEALLTEQQRAMLRLAAPWRGR